MTFAEAHVLLKSEPPKGGANAPKGESPVHFRMLQEHMAFAHHIRNILSSVRGHAQLLLSATGEAETLRRLEVIQDASGRCCDLADGELRPSASSETEGSRESDAARVAGWACDLAAGEAALRGVEVAWYADGLLPPAAMARTDLERVLLELVRNAVRSTRRPGRVEVRVGAPRQAAGAPHIEIRVSDTGRGIPERTRERMFEPFFTTRGPGDGLGLGLALAASLVRRSGGTIDAESEEGAGTTLSVRIPAA